jgi:hypothetical protein
MDAVMIVGTIVGTIGTVVSTVCALLALLYPERARQVWQDFVNKHLASRPVSREGSTSVGQPAS